MGSLATGKRIKEFEIIQIENLLRSKILFVPFEIPPLNLLVCKKAINFEDVGAYKKSKWYLHGTMIVAAVL